MSTSAERQHLEMVRRILSLETAIGKKKNGSQTPTSYYRIQIGGRSLLQLLTAVGVTPRKSLTIGPLAVLDEISTASPRFAAWLQSRIESRFHVKGALHWTAAGRIRPSMK